MTVSISPCWKSTPDSPARLRAARLLSRGLLLLFWSLFATLLPWAYAAGAVMEFNYSEIVPSEQQYVINTSVALQPAARLHELVEAGVTVPFVAEFVLKRSRWYWLDETIAERTLEIRLSYHALTRQYRVATGSLHRSFSSYEDALRAMLSIRNWDVLERSRLQEGVSYNVALRFRLNLNQLPKPFQMAALGNRDLDLSTGWVYWTFLASPRDAR